MRHSVKRYNYSVGLSGLPPTERKYECLPCEYIAGKIDDRQLTEVEKRACPGAGSCGGMYTANTMSSAIEALGPYELHGDPASSPSFHH